MCATVVVTRRHCNAVSGLVQRICLKHFNQNTFLPSFDKFWCAMRHAQYCLKTKVTRRYEYRNGNFKWEKNISFLFYSNTLANPGEGIVASSVCPIATTNYAHTNSYCHICKRTLSWLNTPYKTTASHRTYVIKELRVMNKECERGKWNREE